MGSGGEGRGLEGGHGHGWFGGDVVLVGMLGQLLVVPANNSAIPMQSFLQDHILLSLFFLLCKCAGVIFGHHRFSICSGIDPGLQAPVPCAMHLLLSAARSMRFYSMLFWQGAAGQFAGTSEHPWEL